MNSSNQNIYDLLKQNYQKAFGSDGYLAPFDLNNKRIEKKLNNSITSVADDKVAIEDVYCFVDSTLFGASDNGFLFTEEEVFYYPLAGKSNRFSYKSLKTCKVEEIKKTDNDGKVHTTIKLLLVLDDGSEQELEQAGIKDLNTFKQLIESLISFSKQQDPQNSNSSDTELIKARTLVDLPKNIQFTYVKIFTNYILTSANGELQKSFNSIYSLVANLNFTPEERFNIISYKNSLEDTRELCNSLFATFDSATKDIVLNSLVKDIVYSHIQREIKKPLENDETFCVLMKEYNVSTEQINLFKQTYNQENQIWNDDVDDSAMEEGLRIIATNAAAVGVPLAALYFTGTIGFSAAGITSGLATLGFGGLFGLSSMVTGIGAILLIGFGAKKGIEQLTGQKEIEKRKRKELMLLQVAKKCQEENNYLMEDINHISSELSKAITVNKKLEHTAQEANENIKRLIERLQVYSQASRDKSAELNRASLYAAKQGVPRIIDVQRVESITNQPSTRKYREVILSAYVESNEGLKLRADISNEQIQLLKQALNTLGYFAAETALKNTADQALSKLKGFFK